MSSSEFLRNPGSGSSKNLLQEFCVKHKHDLPIYDTKKVGGDSHNPEWLSYVTVVMHAAAAAAAEAEGKKRQSVTIPGEISSSKISAEKSAALFMLQSLKGRDDKGEDSQEEEPSVAEVSPTEKLTLSSQPPRMAIFIDVENLPSMIFSSVTLKQKYPKAGITIFACVGKHHHAAKNDFGKRVNKVVVPTTRKDGVDTFIQMYIGHLMHGSEYDSFAIVTGDHFGHALAELIETKFTLDKNQLTQKRASVVTDKEQLFKFFEAVAA